MRSKLSLLVPVLVLALVLSACGSAVSPAAARTLTVTGSGTVYLTPDVAYINVGVHTENPDIAQALADNNRQAQAVVDALENLGVAAEDIQTSSFSIWSMQDYDEMGQTYIKYTVDNTVYVTVRDLTRLGSLLDTVVGAGANNINSIQFDVLDKAAAQAEARQMAMDNAAALAGELAGTAGLKLGEIQSITYSDFASTPFFFGLGGGGGSDAPNASVPIQPGRQQVSVTVNVSYAVK